MSLPKFSLNLDGTLKQRAGMQERDDGQPGLYSPRPSTSHGSSASPSPPSASSSPPPSPSSAAVAGGGRTGGHPALLKTTHADPAQTVTAEEAAMSITDPDTGLRLSARPRLHAGSLQEAGATGPGGRPLAPASGRRAAAAALATLAGYERARQRSPGGTAAGSPPARRSPSAAGSSSSALASAPTAASAASGEEGGAGGLVDTVRLEEAYILGRTFQQFVASTGRQTIRGITGAKGGGPAFRQNPSQYVSALTSAGDYVAMGDRTGHVAVMKRRPMSAEQHAALLAEEAREDAEWLGRDASPVSARAERYGPPRTRDPFEFHVGQQAYTSVIDPLNSVEVTPNVSALAFLPRVSPAAYLLTANEKVPKLYKVMTVRESAPPFRAVDKIDSKTIGPLTAASRGSTVAMKPVARYALSHEYDIHSLCPFVDAEQFVTADDMTMQLWCTEYPDTSIETLDLRAPHDETPREAIRCVRTFPHEPFLLFAVTSAGNVRVIDVRQTLQWSSQTPQLFVNPPRESDGSFSNVTNSLSDCALSPCGRYIAGRDFMGVSLWDVRVAAAAGSGGGSRSAFPSSPSASSTATAAPADCSIVQRWELHPSLRGDLENLYQSDLLFERFDVQFMNHRQVCTGGFGNALYTIDVTRPGGDGASCAQTPTATAAPEDASAGVHVFRLPMNEGATDIARTTFHAKAAGAAQLNGSSGPGDKGKAGRNSLELGSRISLISRPMMSLGGTCGMMLCCGQVIMQLSYQS